MRKELGLTILETAAALAVITPVLLALGLILHGASATTIRTRLAVERQLGGLRLRGIYSDLLEDLDSHRLPVLPRVHKQGQILFTSGAANPVMQAAHGRRPAAHSDAITGFRLDPLRSQRVIEVSRQGEYFRYVGCRRFNTGFPANSYRSYAGLSVDGIVELTGQSLPHPGRSDCRDFLLLAQDSMSFESRAADYPGNIRLLVPISAHYTWYLDEKQRLRFLSHAGAANIENQPAGKLHGRISLDLVAWPAGIAFLKLIHELEDCPPAVFWFNNNLSRIQAFDFLMNMP